MTLSEKEERPPSQRQSEGLHKEATNNDDALSKEAQGGMGSYFVGDMNDKTLSKQNEHLTPRQRVFKYADRVSWTLNIIACIAAIAAGTLLPLMDLVFGKFVSTFTGFALGTISPAQYRSQVNKYTCVLRAIDL